jgi:hypothetical protein
MSEPVHCCFGSEEEARMTCLVHPASRGAL